MLELMIFFGGGGGRELELVIFLQRIQILKKKDFIFLCLGGGGGGEGGEGGSEVARLSEFLQRIHIYE